MVVSDGYSSWIASRCKSTASKASAVNKKYNSSSNDGYNSWIEQRMERLKNADNENQKIIKAVFDDGPDLETNLTETKTTVTPQKDGYNSWIADRQEKYDMEKARETTEKEVNAALNMALNGQMSHNAFEKYLSSMLEKGQITSEQYYTASSKLQINKYENLTGIKIDESELGENTEQEYYEVVERVKTAKVQNIDEFFELYSGLGYGVDQGVFKYCSGEYYNYMIETVREKYHMSYRDAKLFLDSIDSIGACSYAAVCNSIVDYFYNKPKEFEEVFGFPLLKEDSNGNVYLNQGELLADMFFIGNHTQNGGELFEEFGDKTIFSSGALDENFEKIMKQKYMTGIFMRYFENIISYLEYKNGITVCTTKEHSISKEGIKKEDITKKLENSKNLILCLYGKFEYYKIGNDLNEEPLISDGGHAVYITDVTEEGVIVSTWGGEYLIKYENFENEKVSSDLYSIEYDIKDDQQSRNEIEYDDKYVSWWERLFNEKIKTAEDRTVVENKETNGEISRIYYYYDGDIVEEIASADGTVIEIFENHDYGIIRRVTDNNGRITTEYNDGKIRIEHNDGKIIVKEADGTEKMYTNVDRIRDWVGNTTITYRDGTEVVEWASGNKTTTYIDGTEVYVDTNGNKTITYTDGIKRSEWASGDIETFYTDGSRKTEWSSGDVTTIYSDGTVVYEDTDGNKTTTYTDGTKKSEWANGNIETFYTDGSRKVEWSGGEITTIYSDGKVVYEDSNGNITTYYDGKK